MLGTIKFFNTTGRYGILTGEDGQERFFHRNDVVGAPVLTKGRLVSFEPSKNNKGPTAVDVSVVNPQKFKATPHLLSEISEWKVEAKLEDSDRYFYHTREVELIESGKRCYVIGRKGTGKTAISEYLTKKVSDSWFSKKLTFKNFPLRDLYALSNTSYTAPNQYITLWKYVIYSSIAQMMCENENIELSLRQKLEPLFKVDTDTSLSQSISKWTSKGFGAKLFNMGIDFEKSNIKREVSWTDRVEALEKMIFQNLDSSTYVISLDELDEDYKSSSDKGSTGDFQALLTSLFKAVQDIKSIFQRDSLSVLPVIFLRDDIFSQLRDPDRAKWIDLTIALDWNPDKIKNLLAFRISRAIAVNNEIFNFEEAWVQVFNDFKVQLSRSEGDVSIFDAISSRSLMRPRDFVRFLSYCADDTVSINVEKVDERALRRIQSRYSLYLKTELEDEIQGLIPEIYELWDVFMLINKKIFSGEEFQKAYTAKINEIRITRRDPSYLIKQLFEFSVMGNLVPKHGPQFKYLNSNARCEIDGPFYLHPGLHDALNLL